MNVYKLMKVDADWFLDTNEAPITEAPSALTSVL